MTFQQLNSKMQEQFNKMQQNSILFRLNITGQEIWDTYLAGFKPEQDPVFRDPSSTSHTSNDDKNFIRRYGNIVSIDENLNIQTMFQIDVAETDYADTIKAINRLLDTGAISEVFVETFTELNELPYEKCTKTQPKFQLGVAKNLKMYTQEEADKFGVVNTSDIYEFHHFHVHVDSIFVDKTGKSAEAVMGGVRDNKNVFERGMREIPLDTLELVRDLINQSSLLNAVPHLDKVNRFIVLKKEFLSTPPDLIDNWFWVRSNGLQIAKFRNELIGTLCVELAEGVELNKACLTWNKRVDPANYMKASAPITKRQIEEAEKFVAENGYSESFNRRPALIADIDVSEISHMNVDNKTKPVSLFAAVKPSVTTRHKKSEFDGIQEVTIDSFMADILPTVTDMEVFVENRLENNFVMLSTSEQKDSKRIFKWGNNFAWTYLNNLTGKSEIKTAVKTAGGKVDGVLRFSIMWADGDEDNSDLDAHCQEPTGHIFFSNKRVKSGGNLDIDIQRPNGKLAVENITWPHLSNRNDGSYHFYVNQYSERGSKGFRAEIEYNGELFSYEYSKKLTYKQNVSVATVTLKNGEFSILHQLPEINSGKTVWGIETGQFHKVNLVCLSPNHWADNNVGNKHFMFMLQGCVPDSPLRSFHNEYLNEELRLHKKVMEPLADARRIEPVVKQLAGLGFNGTVRDEIIVKLKGTHQRTLKIKF